MCGFSIASCAGARHIDRNPALPRLCFVALRDIHAGSLARNFLAAFSFKPLPASSFDACSFSRPDRVGLANVPGARSAEVEASSEPHPCQVLFAHLQVLSANAFRGSTRTLWLG